MELGYEVETAINGFEGFKAVLKSNPDIITSDYDMPVLNGWEFCTEIRQIKRWSRTSQPAHTSDICFMDGVTIPRRSIVVP